MNLGRARRVDDEEGGAGVDDGVLSAGDDPGASYRRTGDRDLPERGRVRDDEGCKGEAAGECGGVGATEEELASVIEKGEAKDRGSSLSLVHERLEYRWARGVGYRLEGHA